MPHSKSDLNVKVVGYRIEREREREREEQMGAKMRIVLCHYGTRHKHHQHDCSLSFILTNPSLSLSLSLSPFLTLNTVRRCLNFLFLLPKNRISNQLTPILQPVLWLNSPNTSFLPLFSSPSPAKNFFFSILLVWDSFMLEEKRGKKRGRERERKL